MVGRSDYGDERGVSPVISVVLMVAITVTLAATAGYVIFGMADETKATAPQTAITATYDRTTDGDGQALELVVDGGDTLEEQNVYFDLQGAVVADRSSGTETPTELDGNLIQNQIGSETTAGATLTVDHTTVDESPLDSEEYLDLSDATLRLVWDPASADIQETETIWRWSDS